MKVFEFLFDRGFRLFEFVFGTSYEHTTLLAWDALRVIRLKVVTLLQSSAGKTITSPRCLIAAVEHVDLIFFDVFRMIFFDLVVM